MKASSFHKKTNSIVSLINVRQELMPSLFPPWQMDRRWRCGCFEIVLSNFLSEFVSAYSVRRHTIVSGLLWHFRIYLTHTQAGRYLLSFLHTWLATTNSRIHFTLLCIGKRGCVLKRRKENKKREMLIKAIG